MAFHQAPPRLSNQYDDDVLLREYLARALPPEMVEAIEPKLRALGDLGGGELYELMLEDRQHEPVLRQWDAWGHRVDAIEVTEVWKRAEAITIEEGLVATAYEGENGRFSRVHQFVKNHLLQPSMDVYSCPLAMTDGAARTLIASGNQALIDELVPHLISRDPSTSWTSGQWMTERTGGSDVGRSETIARQDENGGWRLWGTKWFTSATTSQMALTLGRPEGNGAGGRGLALFCVQLRDDDGRSNGIVVNRLKDKFGTRKLPTAELELVGARATLVSGTENGIRNIAPMLNVTRTWNAVASAWGMRRAVALVRDYAVRRVAFGAPLAEKPLHVDTVATIVAEAEAAFLLAYRCVELLGLDESGEASDQDRALARVLTPLAKLCTAKQAVAVASEALECFGGAGYVEDTGLPRLLADAQVLPIWEGTTNVLSLDTLRALKDPATTPALMAEVERLLSGVDDAALIECAQQVRASFSAAEAWMREAGESPRRVEAGARRFALTLARSTQLALLVHHAQWCSKHLDGDEGRRASVVARRFAHNRVDLIERETIAEDDLALLLR
jgi:alkylation response protein AidB-like acyl-CoA dehydrogenase